VGPAKLGNMEQPDEIVVSPQTLERMNQELAELTTSGRSEMSERLLRARELGDLKENAEYHSAKDAQGLMEARIRQLQYTIKNAVVREGAADTDIVGTGVIVAVKDGDETEEYLVAQSMEEKVPGVRTITLSSPMGRALLGKRVGEEAIVEAPGGKFSVEIVGLRAF
jgi:transcription elongation factor GreA